MPIVVDVREDPRAVEPTQIRWREVGREQVSIVYELRVHRLVGDKLEQKDCKREDIAPFVVPPSARSRLRGHPELGADGGSHTTHHTAHQAEVSHLLPRNARAVTNQQAGLSLRKW